MRPGTNTSNYKEYVVLKPIKGIQKAEVAPWFDMPGGGTQFKLPEIIDVLKEYKFIKEIE